MELKINWRKITAFLVTLCLIAGLVPAQLLKVHAAGNISVTRAVVYGEYDRYDLISILVQVTISGDSGTYGISYDDTTGVKHTLGDASIPGTSGGTIDTTFTLTGTSLADAVNMKNLYVGSLGAIEINYSSMPSITGTSSNLIDEQGSVTLQGVNFSNVPGTVTMDIEGAVYSNLQVNPDNMTISGISREGSATDQNIVFRKDTLSNTVTVSRKYTNVFRVLQSMNMDLKYTPARGEAGSVIYISFNNDTDVFDDYSVFFLKDTDESYNSSNLVNSSDISYTQDRKIMKVKVPNLPSQSYILQLTNPISGGTGDLGNLITKRQTVGSFFITGVGNAPVIYTVDPVSGPNNGDDVQITGMNFEELNFLEGFINSDLSSPTVTRTIDTIVETASTSLIPGNSITVGTPVEKLRIQYNGVKNDNGNIVNVTRKISAFIGTDTSISATQNVLSSSGDRKDILYVRTKPTPDENKTVDVYLIIETAVEDPATGTETTLPGYIATKDNAYTFVPSYVNPVINTISPDMIQVEPDISGYKSKEDMVIGIHGKDFKVYKYTDEAGNDIVNYPIIGIGSDLNNNEGDIVLKRIGNKVYKPNSSGVFIEDSNYEVVGASIEIMNDNGIIVDGSQGNDTGTSIIITLPKGQNVVNLGVKPIAVKNPVLKSSGNGNVASVKVDAVNFVALAGSNPAIESISPIVTTIDAGELITVKGSNFNSDIRVFIAGNEVPKSSIIYEGGTDGRSATLKFNALKAPLIKEGSTLLMLMNPDGGIAVSNFVYVKTLNQDPSITSFTPDKGTENTAVVVDGDNFMKPNPAITSIDGIGIYQLIGSRILMNGVDINDYNVGTGSQFGIPQPKEYLAPSGNKLLQKVGSTLNLADYYYSVILKGPDNNYYVMDTDSNGQIVLSNGGSTSTTGQSNQFVFGLDSGAPEGISASNNGIKYYVYLREDSTNKQDYIELAPSSGGTSLDFTAWTVYKTNVSGEITGNRVKVLSKTRILFYVPRMETNGGYTITVQNPDTKKAIASNVFNYYSDPQSRFELTSVTPPIGSVEGGYSVIIKGSPLDSVSKVFDDTSKVYINGVQVAASDVSVDSSGLTISAKVPKYTGDLSAEGVDSKAVPITVVNDDGGSAFLNGGFTYVIPSSNPRIDRVEPVEGSAAGGEIVEIWGYDFRFYEPYSSWQKNSSWKLNPKDNNYYLDLDNDVTEQWDAFTTNLDVSTGNFTAPINPAIQGYSSYIKTPIIPKVYFGSEPARVVEFSNTGYIKVITPQQTAGTVDVYVVNNDYGVSNKMKYTYKSSSPKINSITPSVGRKQGKDKVEILGSGFALSSIKVYSNSTTLTDVKQPLIKFGDITNKDLPRTDSNSGLVNGGVTTVKLSGDLEVHYTAVDNKVKVTVNDYTKTYDYYGDTVFVPLMQLTNGSSNYDCFEMIKLEFTDGRLIVERGYSPLVNEGQSPYAAFVSSQQLSFLSPSYYTVGNVNVYVFNPDGGTAIGQFEYRNPDSNPSIVNILKEENPPESVKDSSGTVIKKIQKATYKGGSIITIVGTDFRENATINISDVVTIQKKDIIYNLPGRLTFTMPAVPESAVGKELRIVVVNEDGGIAASDRDNPPIYIVFTKGESSPGIDGITPEQGPSSGGTRVKITGKDFRNVMEGIDKKLKVYFGDVEVPAANISFADYKTIYVITPAQSPGTVHVKVENPDGELAESPVDFTYISNPQIVSVVDPTNQYETLKIETISVEGGTEIKIKGAGFLEGAKVYFVPEIKAVNDAQSATGKKIIYVDGLPYTLESGTEGVDVVFVNGETLKVKTPQGMMDTKGIIVVNPDGGATNIYDDLLYSIPALEAPTGVRAELVYNKYIKIYWSGVTKATEYEIQTVINDSEAETIGNSKLTSFIFEDISPYTTYKFIVKAVGKLGSSKPSDVSNSVTTGWGTGRTDTDGSINNLTTIEKTGESAKVTIGVQDYKAKTLTIDLTSGTLEGSKAVIVSIPASVVMMNDATDITIVAKDYTLTINPKAFRVSRVKENQSRNDAGVRFKVSSVNTGTDLGSIGGFATELSSQYQLQAEVFVGNDSMKIDYLNSSMKLVMDYDSAKAKSRALNYISLNRYDEIQSTWNPLEYATGNSGSISATVGRMGRYLVIGRRN